MSPRREEREQLEKCLQRGAGLAGRAATRTQRLLGLSGAPGGRGHREAETQVPSTPVPSRCAPVPLDPRAPARGCDIRRETPDPAPGSTPPSAAPRRGLRHGDPSFLLRPLPFRGGGTPCHLPGSAGMGAGAAEPRLPPRPSSPVGGAPPGTADSQAGPPRSFRAAGSPSSYITHARRESHGFLRENNKRRQSHGLTWGRPGLLGHGRCNGDAGRGGDPAARPGRPRGPPAAPRWGRHSLRRSPDRVHWLLKTSFSPELTN